ncbi:MAG: NAD(P)-dependent oxidoreductase [bacterium]|nr:NAD(P)-dependent oxidoreductase [bacterium]
MKKPVVITGGCGYVGSRVAQALARLDIPVVILDRVMPKERGLILPELVAYKQVDLKDPKKTGEAIRGSDIVLHLAAHIASLSYMHEHQAEIIADNAAIDASLYPAMLEEGVKAVMYSSSSMVFQNARKYPYTEEDLKDAPPPTNVYGFSKLAGEYFCRAFYAQYDLPYVIIRYHNIYGPGEDSKGSTPGDIHVIPALIEKVLSGQYPLKLLGGEDATRPFTYVDDAVRATVMLVKRVLAGDERVMNTDFNIGPGKATQILDLAKKIWELFGDGRPFRYEVEKTNASTSVRREMNPGKIRSIVGWQEKISLEDGILKTAEWIKSRKQK